MLHHLPVWKGFMVTFFFFLPQKELKEIKEACQKLTQERERGQQDLSEAVKFLKVCVFNGSAFITE